MSACVNMVNTVISAAPPLQASHHHKHPQAAPDPILCDSYLIQHLICTVTSSLLPPECSREHTHVGRRMALTHTLHLKCKRKVAFSPIMADLLEED